MISHAITQLGQPLQRLDTATPTPSGSQVLLRTLASGVCHSDVHTWQGWYDLGQGKRLDMASRGVALPLTLGHEIVGEVVAAGPDALAAGVLPGQRRLVYPWIGCGGCRVCQRGREHLCAKPAFLGIFRNGGYASHVSVPHPRYLLDIADLAPAQAAPYACSGLTAFSAIGKLDTAVLAEEPVVVIGAGGVGLMAVSLLGRLAGRAPVVVEPDAGRRQAALDAGASAAIDPDAPGAASAIRAAAGGAVWAVIDCVGAGRTVQLGLDLLTKGGQLVQVGLFGGEVTLSTPLVPMRAISLIGAYIGSLAELQALLALMLERRLRPVPVHCRCLDDADSALHDLEHGRVVGRLVLTPDGLAG
jgi:propanol-preferring alcohol dehydrogenase